LFFGALITVYRPTNKPTDCGTLLATYGSPNHSADGSANSIAARKTSE
jgi:hypothetical protein